MTEDRNTVVAQGKAPVKSEIKKGMRRTRTARKKPVETAKEVSPRKSRHKTPERILLDLVRYGKEDYVIEEMGDIKLSKPDVRKGVRRIPLKAIDSLIDNKGVTFLSTLFVPTEITDSENPVHYFQGFSEVTNKPYPDDRRGWSFLRVDVEQELKPYCAIRADIGETFILTNTFTRKSDLPGIDYVTEYRKIWMEVVETVTSPADPSEGYAVMRCLAADVNRTVYILNRKGRRIFADKT